MSEYGRVKTEFNDKDCLVAALIALGYTADQIEIHETPQQLFNYWGKASTTFDQTGDKANVIIRKKNLKNPYANDLGFKQEADGSYAAIYDDSAHDASWFDGLKRHYTESKFIKTCEEMGAQMSERTETADGVEIEFLIN